MSGDSHIIVQLPTRIRRTLHPAPHWFLSLHRLLRNLNGAASDGQGCSLAVMQHCKGDEFEEIDMHVHALFVLDLRSHDDLPRYG